MLTFSHRRAIHRTVLSTLAAWVLVLMAGIANACVMHDRVAGHDGQVQVIDRTHQKPSATPPEKPSRSPLPSKKAATAPPVEPAAVQTLGVGPNIVSVAVITQSVAEGEAARGPPGAIRFLRLRL